MATNGMINGDVRHSNGINHAVGAREANEVGKRPIRIAGCSGGTPWLNSSVPKHSPSPKLGLIVTRCL